jgi:hypothetical protein
MGHNKVALRIAQLGGWAQAPAEVLGELFGRPDDLALVLI